MPRAHSIVTVAVLALAAVAATASAKPANFSVHAKQTSFHQSGAGTISFKERLTRGSKTVGHDSVSCKPTVGDIETCTGTLTLTGKGSITVSGTLSESGGDSILKIRSGTGSYEHAKGTMRLHHTGATSEILTFTFS